MNLRRPNLVAPSGMCDTHMHCYDTSIPSAPGGLPLPGHEAQIKRLPGRFVIDHVGKFLEPVAPEHESFKSLLRLVNWVPDEITRRKILADNPAELFGYPRAGQPS